MGSRQISRRVGESVSWRSLGHSPDSVVRGGRDGDVVDGVPSVAVFSDGEGGWEIRDGNTDPPDAYIVTPDAGSTFEIDSGADAGLTLTIADGRPVIAYP